MAQVDYSDYWNPGAENPPPVLEQQQPTANRWTRHLANNPWGAYGEQYAKQWYDDPNNKDPGASLKQHLDSFRAQWGSAAPADDQSLMNMIASGQTPQPQNAVAQWSSPQVQSQVNTQQTAENKARADQVWATLSKLVDQSQNVGPDNPVVRAQTDAFRAEKEREKRNFISDTAERYGPLANIRGEERMASDRTGNAVASFQADAMVKELTAIRSQIMAALNGQQGFVSTDRQQYLNEQLAMIDQQLRSLGLSQDWQRTLMGNDLSLRELGLQEWDRMTYYDLLQRGLLG